MMDKRKREETSSSSSAKKKKKKQRVGKGKSEGEGKSESVAVTFNELELTSQEFKKMSDVMNDRINTVIHMEKEMARRCKTMEEMAKLAPGVKAKMDSGLETMRFNLLEVISKSTEIKDYVENFTSEMQESLEDMGEKLQKGVQEAKNEQEELRQMKLQMIKKAKELDDKSLEIALRIKAMKSLLNEGFGELELCEMRWATKLEVDDGVLALSRLKLADAATSIAMDNERILSEVGHIELCKGIPTATMSDTYRQNRDAIVEQFSSPQSFLQNTLPYECYKKDLQQAKDFHLNAASEFTSQVREEAQKLMMVKNEEDYHKVKELIEEGKKMANQGAEPAEPPCFIIPAVPENSALLKQAMARGFKVLLYMEKEM